MFCFPVELLGLTLCPLSLSFLSFDPGPWTLTPPNPYQAYNTRTNRLLPPALLFGSIAAPLHCSLSQRGSTACCATVTLHTVHSSHLLYIPHWVTFSHLIHHFSFSSLPLIVIHLLNGWCMLDFINFLSIYSFVYKTAGTTPDMPSLHILLRSYNNRALEWERGQKLIPVILF